MEIICKPNLAGDEKLVISSGLTEDFLVEEKFYT